MNLKQPYEQLMADKLRKLPAPDTNESWQQMKQLLDEEDHKTGGAKRPPGNKNGWWRIGAVVIALSACFWFYVDNKSANTSLVKNNTAESSTANAKPAEKENGSIKNATNSDNHQSSIIDNNATLPVKNETANAKNKINNKVIDKPASATVLENNHSANNTIAVSASKKNNKAFIIDQSASNKTINQQTQERIGLANANSPAKNKSKIENNRDENIADHFTDNVSSKKTSTVSDKYAVNKKYKNDSNRANHSKQSDNRYLPVNQTNETSQKNWFAIVNGIEFSNSVLSANTSLALRDSIKYNLNTTNLLNNETKKQVAKAKRDKEIEDLTKKDKRSFHLDLSNVFKPFSLHIDTDPRWTAGISLNSSVPLNAQSRYNYNMNAKSGTLSDYIPSVYLQFHLNDYVYAQTEINFISPQYTPQILVYQQTTDMGNGISQQKTINLQKLYYFNLPVSLHYSPINNFYFSAGLQFSSFQSGLVSIQQKQYATAAGPDHPTSFTSSVVKFKDDSIAATLSPNEWRWQIGADYYWNRFSFGMRYNKSFKDLLNLNLSNSVPPASLRNESMIFFVRYNLFESRKKGEPSQKN